MRVRTWGAILGPPPTAAKMTIERSISSPRKDAASAAEVMGRVGAK